MFLQCHYNVITTLLQCYYNVITMLLQYYYNVITMILHCHYNVTACHCNVCYCRQRGRRHGHVRLNSSPEWEEVSNYEGVNLTQAAFEGYHTDEEPQVQLRLSGVNSTQIV